HDVPGGELAAGEGVDHALEVDVGRVEAVRVDRTEVGVCDGDPSVDALDLGRVGEGCPRIHAVEDLHVRGAAVRGGEVDATLARGVGRVADADEVHAGGGGLAAVEHRAHLAGR